MILVDTSVWIAHFRGKDERLRGLIAESDIGLHPYVLGELALGGLPRKGGAAFTHIAELDEPPVASTAELLAFIGWAKLASTGIGFVDAHLLVSARMVAGARILTRDKNLHAQARRLGVAFAP